MAKEAKKDPQELTVEQKLKALFQLQTMLSKIDEIKTLRGELPLEVQDLEDEIAGLSTRIDRIKAEVAELKSAIATKKVEIETSKASIAKYKEQQENVRNNREYDFLSKEIEFQTLEMELCDKRIKEFAAQEQEKSAEAAKSTEALDERQKDLDVKKNELDEIISETKQEEEKLRDKAKELETKIEPRLLQSFKRIRKNSRNGLGIVYVQRDACGGCFNKIPPQRQLDICSRKKIIVCEYCGRIMIDPELAGVTIEHKEEALASYKMLKEKATNVERRQLAETGILRCAFLLRDDVETIHAATDLLVEPKLSPELRNEALYYRAKAYTNQKAGKKAMDDYRELAKDTRNSYGAEAKYQVAQGLYDAKEYAAAEKELLNYIEQSTPHAYWLARSFVLLSDVYHATGKDLDARQYLLSLQQNYQGNDDIESMIESRLQKLKTEN